MIPKTYLELAKEWGWGPAVKFRSFHRYTMLFRRKITENTRSTMERIDADFASDTKYFEAQTKIPREKEEYWEDKRKNGLKGVYGPQQIDKPNPKA